MTAPTTLMELAQLAGMSEIATAILAVFGVLVALAVLIKGVCVVLEQVRGEGNGICKRSGGFGTPDDRETRSRQRKPSQGGKGGLC